MAKNKYKLCKALINQLTGEISFKSDSVESLTLPDIIENDKKYGVMKPRNDKYFTYQVLNGDDEISEKQVHKMVKFSFRRYEIRIPVRWKANEAWEDQPDFRISFRTVFNPSIPSNISTSGLLMLGF